ncbi:MAG: thioredoxin [Sedimentisphaerales bacterium]|nr:thioredoxin [Sedimentisphaerales bacterium]
MAENLVEITDANFEEEVINSDLPVLVDFWAEWCGPCRLISPIVEELATEYQGKVKVGKVNVDEDKNTAVKYQIMNIPTIIIFNKGEIVEKKIGMSSSFKKDLKAVLDNVI